MFDSLRQARWPTKIREAKGWFILTGLVTKINGRVNKPCRYKLKEKVFKPMTKSKTGVQMAIYCFIVKKNTVNDLITAPGALHFLKGGGGNIKTYSKSLGSNHNFEKNISWFYIFLLVALMYNMHTYHT